MKIIGLGHKKNVGKDCIARFLSTEYRLRNKGSCVVRKGFADPLKDICYQLFHWANLKPKEYYDQNPNAKSDILDALGMTVRDLYIAVGMQMRKVYPNVWIDNLLQGISADLLIITDLRFHNELEAIKNRNGYVIRVDRPSVPDTLDEADGALAECEDWDHIIVNDGTLTDLHNEACNLIDTFLAKG